MNMFDRIKELLGFADTRNDRIERMPENRRGRRFHERVTEHMAEVNSRGQIYIPNWRRVSELGPLVMPGDTLSADFFAPGYFDCGAMDRRDRVEVFIECRVTSNNMITIPAEIRDNLDLREGDVIAVHTYWRKGRES